MRVLRVYPTLPPYPGGVEQHVTRLSESQRSAGIDVVVLYNFGTAVHPSDMRITPSLSLHRIRPQCLRDAIFYSLAIMSLLWVRKKFDVVHIHGDWSAFIGGALLAKAIGARTRIASVHDRLKKGRTWDYLYSRVLRGYDFCYSTGQADAKRLSRLLDTPTAWITSGLHPIFFEERPDADTTSFSHGCDVLTVATLSARKRLDLVLQIAKLLPRTRFRIVGEGPERPKLEALIRQNGIDNVVLTGKLDVEQVRMEYSHARLFLLTSASEGTPTAVLEAMACGLPVVTSASNDFSDLLENNRTGYVVESSSAQDYADKITAILDHEDLRGHMGRINREKSVTFSWPKIADRISRSMGNALESDRGSVPSMLRAK